MGIFCRHGPSSDHGRRVQRGRRTPAAGDPRRPRRRRAPGQRPGARARTGSAAGVQAPAGAAGGRRGRRARRRPAAAVPAQRPSLKPIHDWVQAYERSWSERFDRWTTCWKNSSRRRKEMAVTSSGTATVTLPTDEQILITREFDAPRHLVYRAWTTPGAGHALVERSARRDDARRDRPARRRDVALRDGRPRRIRGRLPRRVSRDRPGRADRHRPRSTRACPTATRAVDTSPSRRRTGARRSSSCAALEQGAPRRASSTRGWRAACRSSWMCSSSSRSRCAETRRRQAHRSGTPAS